MAPPPAAVRALLPIAAAEEDPIWAGMLASPLVESDLSEEERGGLEEAEAELRAGRECHSQQEIAGMVDEMRHAAGE